MSGIVQTHSGPALLVETERRRLRWEAPSSPGVAWEGLVRAYHGEREEPAERRGEVVARCGHGHRREGLAVRCGQKLAVELYRRRREEAHLNGR